MQSEQHSSSSNANTSAASRPHVAAATAFQDILQAVLLKINPQASSESTTKEIYVKLLEGGLETYQQQNATQFEEICYLKQKLFQNEKNGLSQSEELELTKKQIQKLTNCLHSSKSVDTSVSVQGVSTRSGVSGSASSEASDPMKALASVKRKATELKKDIRKMDYVNKRQAHRILELEDSNACLSSQLEESKKNKEDDEDSMSQFKSDLENQVKIWKMQFDSTSAEASEYKNRYNFLRTQFEVLSNRLKETQNKLKLHEMDKVKLAQQLLMAEEQRRFIRQKLRALGHVLEEEEVDRLGDVLLQKNEAYDFPVSQLQTDNRPGVSMGGDTSLSTLLHQFNRSSSKKKPALPRQDDY